MLSTTADDLNEKTADNIEEESPKHSKTINIKLKMLPLMMIPLNLKYQNKNHRVTSIGA